jgi:hypothetical protein
VIGTVVGSLFIAVAPANASVSVPAGWTEASFVAAAVNQGVAPGVAQAAWGNRKLMESIPVSVTTSSSSSASLGAGASASLVSPNSAVQYWEQCTATDNNIFGGLLMQLGVKVTWDVLNGAAPVYSEGVTYSFASGNGWAFTGIVGSQNYYSTYNGHSNGEYTGYRAANFTNSIGGTNVVSMWDQTTGRYTGGHACASGGGA